LNGMLRLAIRRSFVICASHAIANCRQFGLDSPGSCADGRRDIGMADNHTIRAIERSVTQISRIMGRRNLGRSTERRLEGLVDFTHVGVVDALAASRQTNCTVGDLAKRMGVDPSRGSRIVAKAIRAGYAKRVASQEDGRRTCVALTKKGEEFKSAIENLRFRHFESQLQGWSDEDCLAFARLLARFLNDGGAREAENNEDDLPDEQPRKDELVLAAKRKRARKRGRL
jgi:DNA-binding MarR family transcriptional regulator